MCKWLILAESIVSFVFHRITFCLHGVRYYADAGGNDGAEPGDGTTPTRSRVVDHTHEVMFVQGDSADIPASITEITQVRHGIQNNYSKL